jgi:hypothetical protein
VTLREDDGGSNLNWLTPQTLLTLGGLGLALLLVAAVIGWLLWRRLRRTGVVKHGLAELRTAITRPGPARDIALLRKEMRDNLTATRQVLTNLPDAPVGLELLTARLDSEAAALDQILALLEREPDRALLEQTLPPIRLQVHALITGLGQIRRTALTLTTDLRGSTSEKLQQELADQIAGIQAGVAEVREISHRNGLGP